MMKCCLRRVCFKMLLYYATFAIAAVIIAGCGQKGPPKLPKVKPPVGVSNLSVKLEGGDIVLRWSAKGDDIKTDGVEGYLIYRSAEPVSEEECDGCPVLFKRGEKVPLVDKASKRVKLEYRETSIPGTRYRFKVLPYDAQGGLGPDSNIVKIVTD